MLHTPPEDLSALEVPAYALFRPWSHTDKRHVVKLASGLHASEDGLLTAQHAHDGHMLYRCLLEPMTSLDFVGVVRSDTDRIDRIMQDDYGPLTNADLPFLSVSWTKGSPDQLRIESRRMALRKYAFDQCNLASEFPATKAARTYFILTLLDPEAAIISPGA